MLRTLTPALSQGERELLSIEAARARAMNGKAQRAKSKVQRARSEVRWVSRELTIGRKVTHIRDAGRGERDIGWSLPLLLELQQTEMYEVNKSWSDY